MIEQKNHTFSWDTLESDPRFFKLDRWKAFGPAGRIRVAHAHLQDQKTIRPIPFTLVIRCEHFPRAVQFNYKPERGLFAAGWKMTEEPEREWYPVEVGCLINILPGFSARQTRCNDGQLYALSNLPEVAPLQMRQNEVYFDDRPRVEGEHTTNTLDLTVCVEWERGI
jgi:hypothetical protein